MWLVLKEILSFQIVIVDHKKNIVGVRYYNADSSRIKYYCSKKDTSFNAQLVEFNECSRLIPLLTE